MKIEGRDPWLPEGKGEIQKNADKSGKNGLKKDEITWGRQRQTLQGKVNNKKTMNVELEKKMGKKKLQSYLNKNKTKEIGI